MTASAPKIAYQIAATGDHESQLQMLTSLELSEDAHRSVLAQCNRSGIEFMSTPFDSGSVDLLVALGVGRIKISSADITNAPLLLRIARTGKPVILSTGMSTLEEVRAALGVLAFGYLGWEHPSIHGFERAYDRAQAEQILRQKVTLLHCTTEYPAPFDSVNLRALPALGESFSLPVGLSDHTVGIAVAVAAVALGACVIEKHLTLDRTFRGPDHAASVEPDEFRELVAAIRQIELALGSSLKQPAPCEERNRVLARRSLVAVRDIAAGESFSEANLGVRRPGSGVSPLRYWDYLGRPADRSYRRDDAITP